MNDSISASKDWVPMHLFIFSVSSPLHKDGLERVLKLSQFEGFLSLGCHGKVYAHAQRLGVTKNAKSGPHWAAPLGGCRSKEPSYESFPSTSFCIDQSTPSPLND
ncbi:hypothetical protein ACH5RR_036459 [Cinchona calisaya]|uniref:Uncharacterized protein n=1 Tax=Cinchona calisaya TaxID=153742 RepID=A0ABD2Y548_9GENT